MVWGTAVNVGALGIGPLVGGCLAARRGAVARGTTGIVLEAAAPEDRLAMTSQLLIALFGPLDPRDRCRVSARPRRECGEHRAGLAILVGLGVAGAGWGLLARRPKSSRLYPVPPGPLAGWSACVIRRLSNGKHPERQLLRLALEGSSSRGRGPHRASPRVRGEAQPHSLLATEAEAHGEPNASRLLSAARPGSCRR